MKIASLILSLLLTAALHAGPRSSTNYNVVTDTADGGGKRATSVNYTNDGSAGGISGTSTVAAPAATAKAGYLGQLYEVTGLQLAATPATVSENATRLLSAVQVLDDLTTLAVPTASITWSVQSGPLTSISTAGLATAGTVYQDTLATAQGSYAGNTGTLGLTVLNVNTDDIPGYTGDGLDDAWQVQYFGLSNPNAEPSIDADFDGQTNLFEFTAGLSPISAASRFLLHNAPVPNQPGQMRLVISPRLPDRTYTVKTSPTLGPAAIWTDLTGFTTSDNGSERTVTDTSATGTQKFYRVQITKP
ncbi:hypothetical protein [Prosthecobacter sp.]|uniref:hypothetical protein n=1 Tax=Prosthecobacter sp. TaxID=1965333 RepID=UPI002ABAA27D|nr:hypothetical protein [Prosthecobacter sp.]MDZ4405736.1 hypothetical protein [Prosthecobacter sp.]